MPFKRHSVMCTIAASLVFTGLSAADPVERRIVALSGTDGPLGPGLGPGITFGSLDASIPMIDDLGGVAFRGLLAGVPTSTRSAYFHERYGALTVVVRAGDPAPQFHPQGYLEGLGTTSWNLSHDGFLSFSATADFVGSTPLDDRLCYWSENENGLNLVLQELDPVPGAPDGYYFGTSGLELMSVGGGGNFAFEARIFHPTEPPISGIWTYRNGALAPTAIEGMPGHEAGSTIGEVWTLPFYFSPSMTPDGVAAFITSISRPGEPSGEIAYLVENGALTPLAEENAQAPGFPAGVVLDRYGSVPTVNRLNRVAFEGVVFDPATTSSARAILSDRAGSLGPIVVTGSPMPGVDPPANFTYITKTSLNAPGDIAFRGYDSVTDAGGYWLARADGELVPLHILGSQAPGCPPGVSLKIQFGNGPYLNNAGHTAMHATYSTAEVPTGGAFWGYPDAVLFASNSAGRTVMLFRTGQPFEVSHGDVRWIDNLGFFTEGLSPDAGIRQTFNDHSEFACRLAFTDGSYAIVVGQPLSFCSADTNGDGLVNFADINEVLGAFNNAVLEPHYDFDADLDFDGKIDFADLNLVISQLGDDCGGQ